MNELFGIPVGTLLVVAASVALGVAAASLGRARRCATASSSARRPQRRAAGAAAPR